MGLCFLSTVRLCFSFCQLTPKNEVQLYIFKPPWKELVRNVGLPYVLDYKTHSPHQIWEENGGVSYSLNVAYLAHCRVGGELFMLLNILPHFLFQNVFSYFPPLKSRCVL